MHGTAIVKQKSIFGVVTLESWRADSGSLTLQIDYNFALHPVRHPPY